jgi:hypothetical protein
MRRFFLESQEIIAQLISATVVVLYHLEALQLSFFPFSPPFFSTLSNGYATLKFILLSSKLNWRILTNTSSLSERSRYLWPVMVYW